VDKWLNARRDFVSRSCDGGGGDAESDVEEHMNANVLALIPNIRFPMMTPAQLADLLLNPLAQSHMELLVGNIRTAMAYHKNQKMSPLVALTLLLATVSASPKNPFPEVLLPFLAAGGGQKPGDISKAPPQVAAMLQMSTADQINAMATNTSMSGPLAALGVIIIIISAAMAASYASATNLGQQGSFIQRRSLDEAELENEGFWYTSSILDSIGSPA